MLSGKKEIKKDILWRAYLVYLGILLFGLLIIGKAIFIQNKEGKDIATRIQKQEVQMRDIEAMRGNICSDNGTPLATSIPMFDIRLDLSSEIISDELFHQTVDSLAFCLSQLVPTKSPSTFKNILYEARRNEDRYVFICNNLTYPDLNRVRKFPLLRLGKNKGGLIIIPHYHRELPYKDLAKRIVGFESEIVVVDPKTNHKYTNHKYIGLEGAFTNDLQGTNGKQLFRRVGKGAWIPVKMENITEPENGEDIISTLDINMQDLVESALRKELIADSAEHGCAIVMEVQTGYVKAIANLGKVGKGIYEEDYNYAIGECTEPGSTFKLASFLVALEDGKIDLNTLVNTGNGVVMYHGRKMEDSHHSGPSQLTAQQVFEKSSNVGTSKLITGAYDNEPQKYISGLYRLSINTPLDLQINGEGCPYIKNTKDKHWSAVSLPWMSIGYEVAISPIQILTLYNAIANNGKMVKPLFVLEIRKNGKIIQTFPPEVINPSICSQATIHKAKTLLEGVVERGTGSALANTGFYKIAGKTGTAMLAADNRGYAAKTKQVRYKGSFVGYFPTDHPKYSIMVVIHNPRGGRYYGAVVAIPVFRAISDRIFAGIAEEQNPVPHDTANYSIPWANAGIQRDIETVYSQLNINVKSVNNIADWTRPYMNKTTVMLLPQPIIKNSMPDVRGMGIKDALFLLEQMGMRVVINGKGTVTRQSLQPGVLIAKGSIIVLDLSIV
ncbi:MAG: penicillin-binding protein [Bacteroidetes bacterium]|nr:penicillin-binding protein [Bacteroidota bacterium]